MNSAGFAYRQIDMMKHLAGSAAPGNGRSVTAVRLVITADGITAKRPFLSKGDRRTVIAMSSGKIFISYRRADSQWAAARVHDTLANAFPDDHLFMDVEHIAPGQDFVDVLAN
ncbi:MAG: hypothetical protein P8I56_04570 [Paracoccaceae bacterium]|jgi:hypothetical protein|nr:hypothetical protein [Paracoccaceae bacterium]MDG1970242.1 hypothetical protein [Paracoccaceae bacterium]